MRHIRECEGIMKISRLVVIRECERMMMMSRLVTDDEKMEFNDDEEPDLSACIPAHTVEGKSIDFTINLKLTGNSPNENRIERQISNRFVLCSQSPHVHAQFRISIEEPETTMMST